MCLYLCGRCVCCEVNKTDINSLEVYQLSQWVCVSDDSIISLVIWYVLHSLWMEGWAMEGTSLDNPETFHAGRRPIVTGWTDIYRVIKQRGLKAGSEFSVTPWEDLIPTNLARWNANATRIRLSSTQISALQGSPDSEHTTIVKGTHAEVLRRCIRYTYQLNNKAHGMLIYSNLCSNINPNKMITRLSNGIFKMQNFWVPSC